MQHLAALFAVLLALTASGADHPELARVSAADDARVAAMLASRTRSGSRSRAM